MIYLTASHLHQPPAGLCSAERFAPATCEATVENSPYLVIFNGMWWDMTKNRMDISTIMVQYCVEWLEFLYTPHPMMDSNILVKYTMFKWVRWYRFFFARSLWCKKNGSENHQELYALDTPLGSKPCGNQKSFGKRRDLLSFLSFLSFFFLTWQSQGDTRLPSSTAVAVFKSHQNQPRNGRRRPHLSWGRRLSTARLRRIPGITGWALAQLFLSSSADTPWDASQSICLP